MTLLCRNVINGQVECCNKNPKYNLSDGTFCECFFVNLELFAFVFVVVQEILKMCWQLSANSGVICTMGLMLGLQKPTQYMVMFVIMQTDDATLNL